MDTAELQAAGNFVALALTGGGLLWSIYSRNQERRENEAGQARTITAVVELRRWIEVPAGPDDVARPSVRIVVTNHGAAPILDLTVTAQASVTRNERPRLRHAHADVLPGSKDFVAILDIPDPIPYFEEGPLVEVDATLTFTDAAGRRWARRGLGPPRRLIDHPRRWNLPGRRARAFAAQRR
ncbi:hypothetical protein KBX26_04045 [Micromonospora sp. C97]|uniref:hypothetical protein n=1 Tax=Micromonospora sp. C97 TaxID=2824883 RepID=UPI001B3901F5|nr:hypothetical protein [Micromonospora sp. C97]MBQ1029178.1 hypothetical protein [Micromonospora sp. C97]